MFSGQGSQYYRMGKELYENHLGFKGWMDHCDEIVHPLIGISLLDVIYRQGNKGEPFDRILYTNPGLLCIQYSLARLLIESDVRPDYLLGYSLGEITASIVSGAVSLEDGIRLVVDFAALLEAKTQPARMLAIIESEDIMMRFPSLFENCWLTGRIFQNNFVVSGLPKDIHNLKKVLNQKNIMSQELPVNYGFHTELIDSLEAGFKELVRGINLSPVNIPIISSFMAGKIQEVDEEYFWKLVRYPVEFGKAIRMMLQKGDFIFIDAGPSGSLATSVKYLLPSNSNSLYLETINQFGRDLNSMEKLKVGLSALT